VCLLSTNLYTISTKLDTSKPLSKQAMSRLSKFFSQTACMPVSTVLALATSSPKVAVANTVLGYVTSIFTMKALPSEIWLK